jgi:hypothetical protein
VIKVGDGWIHVEVGQPRFYPTPPARPTQVAFYDMLSLLASLELPKSGQRCEFGMVEQ